MSYDQFRLDGKNIVITGASSGIGRQCAVECSKRGANLALIDKNEIGLKLTLEMMDGSNHLMIPLDITDFDIMPGKLESIYDKFKTVNGIVHSAGIQMTEALNRMTVEKYRKLFDINVYSGFEITRVLTQKKFVAQEGSSVVFLAAVMGIVGKTGVTGYTATKGAIISATRSLASELAKKRVRVNSISPGLILTDLVKSLFEQLTEEQITAREKVYPFGLGDVQDIANAAVFLLSDASRWITGINLVIDGGYLVK